MSGRRASRHVSVARRAACSRRALSGLAAAGAGQPFGQRVGGDRDRRSRRARRRGVTAAGDASARCVSVAAGVARHADGDRDRRVGGAGRQHVGARAALVVVPVHVQPGPEAAIGPAPTPGLLTSAVSPAGSVSVTVTALPSVGSAPALAHGQRQRPRVERRVRRLRAQERRARVRRRQRQVRRRRGRRRRQHDQRRREQQRAMGVYKRPLLRFDRRRGYVRN